MGKKQVLRVQSTEGTKRIEISGEDSTRELYEKCHDAFSLQSYNFSLFKDRSYSRSSELPSSRSKTVGSYQVNHGDVIYLKPVNGASIFAPATSGDAMDVQASGPKVEVISPVKSVTNLSFGVPLPPVKKQVEEDNVDTVLETQNGRIERGKDAFCRHGENSMCVRCSALEPFDEGYLAEQKIKHMSFQAYLRKLASTADRGKFAQLEDISCRLKPDCQNHPSDLEGGCPRCRPGAVTLNRQVYRHVDNVMFENPQIVERFLNYWRKSGNQRIGYLYGWFEQLKDVPLGIKAVVAAIYEPPQENSRDSVRFLPDPHEADVDSIAKRLGLSRLGWIFTDLVSEDAQQGTVRNFRNTETHFLSAQECIIAGRLQAKHPNPCKYSSEGHFGSKFVTICVTGDANHRVHMEGYQVSNQCMSLAADGILIPTKDAPELASVREPSKDFYVPDVYYKTKDEYGNEVSKLARPFPVEYLLVDVPVSTPLEPVYTFTVRPDGTDFPVENRSNDVQDLSALQTYLRRFELGEFLDAASDFHFLVYIASLDLFPIKEHLDPLLKAVKEKERLEAYNWREQHPWATLEQIFQESVVSDATPREAWTCNQCTFINHGRADCEMCGFPRT